MDDKQRQREFEQQFINQLSARALALTRGKLPADDVAVESTPEAADAARAELTRLGIYDRGALDELPSTQSIQLRFTRKILGGLMNTTKVRLRARTLCDIEALVKDQPPGPVGREAVRDALAQYALLPKKNRPSAVVLASATGFTADAKALVDASGDPSLILLGGREDGGWDLTLPERVKKTPWAKLFELETRDDRLRRLRYHLEQNAAQLDSRGISLDKLAEKLGLPVAQTELLVRRACRDDSRLMTVSQDGTIRLCRTPFADKGSKMTIWTRIKRMLGFKPTPAEMVRELTAQRVQIEQQRHEVDERVNTLETSERELLGQGAKAASRAEKQQLAGKLLRTRSELKRLRSQQQLFTQQINIIGTQIHNLTMAEQGRRVALPKAEDLTATAAEAEQVVAELAANADLAASIEVSAETPMMSEEHDAILAEFDEIAAQQSTGQQTTPAAANQTSASTANPAGAQKTPDRSAAESKTRRAPAAPEPPAGEEDSGQQSPEAT